MALRGALSFNELTPRYNNFEKRFKQLGLKGPTLEMHEEKIPSIRYIDSLFNCLINSNLKVNEFEKQIQKQML